MTPLRLLGLALALIPAVCFAAAAEPVRLTDALGRVVEIARPPQRIVPIMNCRLEPFGDAYGIYVFNGANVAYTLPQGAQVGWILSNGRQGVFTIGAGGLAAGSGLLVDVSGTYENCTARVL